MGHRAARLQCRSTQGASELSVYVLPYRPNPFAIAPRAASSVGADPVTAAHKEDVRVTVAPHVFQTQGTLRDPLILDRIEARELVHVRRFPAHRHVATDGGHESLTFRGTRVAARARRHRACADRDW